MRNSAKMILSTLLIILIVHEIGFAQSNIIKENVNLVISQNEIQGDHFSLKNINGAVRVTGYDGDRIIIQGTKEVWKNRGVIEADEVDEIQIVTRNYEGTVYVYLEAPGVHAEFFDGRMDYHWHDNNWEERNRIQYNFDLEIRVPKTMMISASTVNGGEVFVENMLNGVKASNVNGSVKVKDVKGNTKVNTVNGDIEVWFLESPTSDTEFHTVNGTIEVYSPKDLDAIVTFESVHGDLYTDFEQVKRLPNRLSKEEDRDGYRYRINQNSPIQIGDGKYEMSFKMVNGSAYIRERKS